VDPVVLHAVNILKAKAQDAVRMKKLRGVKFVNVVPLMAIILVPNVQ
jgi:hypothetical protein